MSHPNGDQPPVEQAAVEHAAVEQTAVEQAGADALPPFSVRAAYAGKHLFVTGTTGFVGKVLLAMIAAEVPDVRRVTVLVRTNRQYDCPRERFDAVVALSEPFQAIAKRMGNEALQTWCDEVVNVVAGDITQDQLGLSDADYLEVTKTDPLDVILHCAGKVDFTPPLDQALAVNSQGVTHKLHLAEDAGCGLVHMSTCFVAGEVSGPVLEDAPVVGYAPNGRPFDPERELEDAVKLASEVRRRADAQALETTFYEKAREALTKKGLDYEDPLRLKDAFRVVKRRWIDDELTREGVDRAKAWGWTNTYTYTKSIGEQCTIRRAKLMGIPVTLVRPAIVESALHFPFPGWNEGVNTCAPFVYIMWKGQQLIPCKVDNIIDVVPVDYVCRGTLVAGAALMLGRAKQVYQFCTGDSNPLHMPRAIELTNLAWRKRYNDDEKNPLKRMALRNMDAIPVSLNEYKRRSAPAVNRFARRAQKLLKSVPKGMLGPAKPIVKQLEQGLRGLEKGSKLSGMILDLFAPFVHDNNPCFSSKNTRASAAELVASEQDVFGQDLDQMDWRHYWIDVHMEGLQKWVFGIIDEKSRPKRRVARARDLVEVFRTATRAHAERKALSHYGDDGVEVTYTYAEFWEASLRVASWLRAFGIEKGDAVILASKNEPAWPMVYFGILLADAVAVPLDAEMPQADATRIAAKAGAKLVICHENESKELGVPSALIGDVFDSEPLANLEQRDRSEEVASLLFTSGTTGDPKGVMLTHGNFTALLAGLHGTFQVSERDRFLSVLPLFHTFEFSCGLLMPMSVGAHMMYLDELEGPLLRRALKHFRPTGMIGVPALWDVLHRRIESEVKDKGEVAHLTFTAMLRFSRFLRKNYGINIGPMAFGEVHRMLGGRIRHFISGGAALSDPVLNAFEGLGFDLLEGYGLTEAAPVLTVRRPGDRKGGGSVGKTLPGVEVEIINPDADGIGEVIARGDNVMLGYLNDYEATQSTVKKGWLHTGDLGKLDRSGRLVLVGRRKELIVTSSGKNVYPDELEPLYAKHDLIDELCIVGVPDPQGDERVGALIVLIDDAGEDAQGEVKAHIQKVGQGLADHQRIRTMRFWHAKLPRTASLKVKRKVVRDELVHLLEMSKASRRESDAVPEGREPAFVYAAIAGLTGQEAVDLEPATHLITDLGLSSLQLVELRLLLEERSGRSVSGNGIANAETIEDLCTLVKGANSDWSEDERTDEQTPMELPDFVTNTGRRALQWAQRSAYDAVFNARVRGREHIPYNQQCIIIANHCSHLDLGMVKYALGDYAPKLSALAASDYFFDTQYKRDFFEGFTNLIPVERSGSLEGSLRAVEHAFQDGRVVLVFPEGTRSPDGQLQTFKHGVGYLQAKSQLPILPVYLRGTHRAMPKGSAFPTARRLTATIGPMITADFLAKEVEGKHRVKAYAHISELLQGAIESLRDGGEYPWAAERKKQQDDGVEAIINDLQAGFDLTKVDKPLTWYFSIGDRPDGKWTVAIDPELGCTVNPGRAPGGRADCVLKTDPAIFGRIVRESYVPGFAEFMDGRVKTNDPNLLRTLQVVFSL